MLKRIMALALAAILIPSIASAAIAPLTDVIALNDLQGNMLTVGDKIISDFELVGISGGGAIEPTTDTIKVQGVYDDLTGDYGLRIICSWTAGMGQTINANINYKVSVIDSIRYADWYIKDVGLMVTGVSTTGTGVVAIGETVWDGPVSAPPANPNLLASLSAGYQGTETILTDHEEFNPVKAIWVRKDISITGGTGMDPQNPTALNGTAHLSEVFQFYSQIPEPCTLGLLAIGGIMTLGVKRRRA